MPGRGGEAMDRKMPGSRSLPGGVRLPRAQEGGAQGPEQDAQVQFE